MKRLFLAIPIYLVIYYFVYQKIEFFTVNIWGMTAKIVLAYTASSIIFAAFWSAWDLIKEEFWDKLIHHE